MILISLTNLFLSIILQEHVDDLIRRIELKKLKKEVISNLYI